MTPLIYIITDDGRIEKDPLYVAVSRLLPTDTSIINRAYVPRLLATPTARHKRSSRRSYNPMSEALTWLFPEKI